MTVESEMLPILRKYGISRLSAFLEGDGIRVRVYGNRTFDQRAYYQKNRERIRKYQHEYYLRTRERAAEKRSLKVANYIPTPQDLARAMAYLYSRNGSALCEDDLRDTAVQVMQFFGFGREVVGNHLEQDDIALMYQLEDIGLIDTRIEEYNLPHGNPWRVNYFVLNVGKIREYSSSSVERDEASNVYGSLPKEAWVR
jgi:hypothetical protein